MSSYPVHRPIPPTQRYSSNAIFVPSCPSLKTVSLEPQLGPRLSEALEVVPTELLGEED